MRKSGVTCGCVALGLFCTPFLSSTAIAQLRLSELEAYEQASWGSGSSGNLWVTLLIVFIVLVVPAIIAKRKVGKYGSTVEYTFVFYKWFFIFFGLFAAALVILRL